MSLAPGSFALIKATWASWLQYRSFFFLLAFGWMVPPLIYLLVWTSAAAENPAIGLTRGQFVAYYLVLILVNQVTYAQTNWTVGDLIRYGSMNTLLLRPLPPIYNALASEIAGKVVYLAFDLPVVAILALALKPELPLTAGAVLAFLPALALAWLLRFLWGYWLALLAFWAARADALLALQDGLIFLLGGLAAPVQLLPPGLRLAANLLPFRYMASFPAEVLMGQVAGRALFEGFLLQAGWLGLALGLSALVWCRGLRRYTALGG